MKVTPLAIPDVLLIEPKIYEDCRGHFYESHNARAFEEAVGRPVQFVQDNHSLSHRGVVRGLHYQLAAARQGKLVRVVAGEVFDVAVDIRRSSPSFGRWVSQTLSADNHKQLWIPEGFAHGFMALSEGTEVLYKASDFYHRAAERAIRWDDSDLAIAWPDLTPILSDKDAVAASFGTAVTFD